MRRLELAGIGTTRVGDIPVLILFAEGDDERVIPVQLDPREVASFAAELEGVKPERPLTHDLAADIVRRMGATVSRVAITEIRDDAFHARVTIATPDGEVTLDARPSDAVALALRERAPIYATDEVLEQGSVVVEFADADDDLGDEEDLEGAIERFRRFLEQAQPEDFGP